MFCSVNDQENVASTEHPRRWRLIREINKNQFHNIKRVKKRNSWIQIQHIVSYFFSQKFRKNVPTTSQQSFSQINKQANINSDNHTTGKNHGYKKQNLISMIKPRKRNLVINQFYVS